MAITKITDVKCHLSQEKLDDLCREFYIPSVVNPVLPDPDQAINQYPPGKIGLYSRFFNYADLRLPFFVFCVDVLRHYRTNVSQLSLFGACKVSHFEVVCRAHNFAPSVALFRRLYVKFIKNGWVLFSKRANTETCYDKALDSVKGWRDRFFWLDAFTCHVNFPWCSTDGVEGDPGPNPNEYSAEEYSIVIEGPAPFRRFPEAFLCWVDLSRVYPFGEDEYPVFRLRGEGMYAILTVVFSLPLYYHIFTIIIIIISFFYRY
jgi:hypothetical protein